LLDRNIKTFERITYKMNPHGKNIVILIIYSMKKKGSIIWFFMILDFTQNVSYY